MRPASAPTPAPALLTPVCSEDGGPPTTAAVEAEEGWNRAVAIVGEAGAELEGGASCCLRCMELGVTAVALDGGGSFARASSRTSETA